MKVTIKRFGLDLEVKTKGMEFEIRRPGGEHLGDVVLNKTGIEWCSGRTHAGKGIKATWEDLISWIET